jgi:hypothetical protein
LQAARKGVVTLPDAMTLIRLPPSGPEVLADAQPSKRLLKSGPIELEIPEGTSIALGVDNSYPGANQLRVKEHTRSGYLRAYAFGPFGAKSDKPLQLVIQLGAGFTAGQKLTYSTMEDELYTDSGARAGDMIREGEAIVQPDGKTVHLTTNRLTVLTLEVIP